MTIRYPFFYKAFLQVNKKKNLEGKQIDQNIKKGLTCEKMFNHTHKEIKIKTIAKYHLSPNRLETNENSNF